MVSSFTLPKALDTCCIVKTKSNHLQLHAISCQVLDLFQGGTKRIPHPLQKGGGKAIVIEYAYCICQ